MGSDADSAILDHFPSPDLLLGIPETFERVVAAHPEVVALLTPEKRLTYDALNRQANRLANTLLAQEIRPGDVVAVGLEDPTLLAASLLGVLKAGGAVVLPDPKSPPARIREILSDSGARWLVTAGGQATVFESLEHSAVDGLRHLRAEEDLDSAPDTNPGLEVPQDSPMVLCYTSGTSGKPKGIRRSLRQGLFEVGTYLRDVRVCPGDRLLMGMSFTYGASTRFVLSALLSGATLCVAPPEGLGMDGVIRFARASGVTHFYTTPSMFRHFCRAVGDQEAPEALRVVTLVAEPLRRSDLNLFRRLMGARDGVLFNSLGSTECGVYCQLRVEPGMTFDEDLLPAGPPVAGKYVFIVDEDRRPLPDGTPGEIAVSSPYLDQIFWKRPDLNQQLLIPNPDRPGERIYYTGDLGVRGDRGWIRILGRRDFQVKIRGYRVEPGEIESILCRHPGIRGAVVLATSPPEGQRMLIAYLQRNPDAAPVSRRDLDRHLLDHLPAYMVPARFLEVDEFPLTARGKVDRRALPGISTRPWESPASGVSDTDDLVVKEVAQIWAGLLGAEPPHSGAGFFEMGGDSILAMHFLTRVRARWGFALPVAVFYQTPTVDAVVRWIAAGGHFGPESAVFPMNPHTAGCPTLIFLPGWIRNTLELQFLARELAGHVNCLGVELPPGGETPETIEELSTYCARIIRSRGTEGPLYLGGFSLGGILAYETGRQLAEAGHVPERILILDTVVPTMRPRPGFPRALRILRNLGVHPWYTLERIVRRSWIRLAQPAWRVVTRTQANALPPSNFGPMPQRAATYAYRPRPSALDLTVVLTWDRRLQLARPEEPWDRLTSRPVRWIQSSVRDHYRLVKPEHVASLAAMLMSDLFPATSDRGIKETEIPDSSGPLPRAG